jgi:prepilin-type processing-associated H-X9-DG protein
LSNQKQMGLGIMQYTQDYDEKYPSAYYYKNGASGAGGYVHWSGAIQPYVKSTQLFVCPSHAQPLVPTNGSTFDRSGTDDQAPKLSYTANELLLPRKRKDTDPSNVVSIAAVQETASVIMLAEVTDVPEAINDTSVASGTNNKSHRPTNGIANTGGGVYDGENASIRAATSFTALTPQQAIDAIKAAKAARSGAGQHHIAYISPDRHLDGAVYTFADGHAKWYKLESTLNPNGFLWGKQNYSAGGQPILDASGAQVR